MWGVYFPALLVICDIGEVEEGDSWTILCFVSMWIIMSLIMFSQSQLLHFYGQSTLSLIMWSYFLTTNIQNIIYLPQESKHEHILDKQITIFFFF